MFATQSQFPDRAIESHHYQIHLMVMASPTGCSGKLPQSSALPEAFAVMSVYLDTPCTCTSSSSSTPSSKRRSGLPSQTQTSVTLPKSSESKPAADARNYRFMNCDVSNAIRRARIDQATNPLGSGVIYSIHSGGVSNLVEILRRRFPGMGIWA